MCIVSKQSHIFCIPEITILNSLLFGLHSSKIVAIERIINEGQGKRGSLAGGENLKIETTDHFAGKSLISNTRTSNLKKFNHEYR
jgi:hypothetical protein